MSVLRKLLEKEYFSEYNSEQDLGATKKKYGKISVYDAGGDLSARWYIYYSFRNPATGKLERQPAIYLDFAEYNTIRERRKAVRTAVEALQGILDNGFDPFADPAAINQVDEPKVIVLEKSASEAIDIALSIGKSKYAESAYPDFKSRLTQYQNYIIEKGYGGKPISELPQATVIDFLNIVLERSSPRNRNNTRTALSDMFNIIIDNKLLTINPVEAINKMKAVPIKNRAFTDEEEERIMNYINERDNWLALFIKFVSIPLLRPIEVARLRVRDLKLKERLIYIRAKNQPVKTKIIPQLLYKDIPDLSKCHSSDFLFTPTGAGKSEATEVNRRQYWGDEFAKVKKELGFGPEYGIYSFRHTYITRLYRELRKELSPFETKSRLMLITGHTSMKALEMYLRDIDAELPEDYSDMLKIKQKPPTK